MRDEEKQWLGICVCFVLTVPAIVMTGMSFHRLQTTEVGLDYNTFTEHVADVVYTKPGLHFLGLTHRFIRFPKTIQTMKYNEADDDILHTRTADGLPVTLGMSFQFRFETARAYELYMTFGGSHLQVLDNEARSVLADVACNYSAYKFFADKQGIAYDMQRALLARFTSKLFASVDALQIETIELPVAFQEAILESIKMKQSIQAMVKYKDNMDVTFQQQVMVAEQKKNQTITLASGDAAQIMQSAMANARITNSTVEAEMYSYGKIADSLGFSESKDELLTYIWWESMKDSGQRQGKSSFMVGLNQAVYVAGTGVPKQSGPSASSRRRQRGLSENSFDGGDVDADDSDGLDALRHARWAAPSQSSSQVGT